MLCSQVYEALLKVEQGDRSVDAGDVRQLVGMGLVNEVGPASANEAEMMRLREELAVLTRERSGLVEPAGQPGDIVKPLSKLDAASREKRIAFLDSKSRELRSRVLDLAAEGVAANALEIFGGKRIQISFAGREAMHNVGPRLGRVAKLEYAAFQAQMAGLEKTFSERGERAKRLLKKLSPKFKTIDEIHLRSAVVGLSALPNQDDEIVDAFSAHLRKTMAGFHRENVVIAAESLTLVTLAGGQPPEASELVSLKDALYGTTFGRYDASNSVEKAATMLWTYAGARRGEVIRNMLDMDGRIPGIGVVPLVILGMEVAEGDLPEDVAQRYKDFLAVVDKYARSEGTAEDRQSAAALLTASEADFAALEGRFRTASALMDQFFLSRHDAAAAMVSVMGQEVAETIDNIRLASSVVTRSKLSLSGLENFSLGLKLIFHTGSLIPVVGASSPVVKADTSPDALNLTLMVPVRVGVPWLVFHEDTVHRRVVSDYRFHPAHSHYVYG